MATRKSQKRSRRNRLSNRLMTEVLERREVMAANLMGAVDSIVDLDVRPAIRGPISLDDVPEPGGNPDTPDGPRGGLFDVDIPDVVFEPAPPPELGATLEEGVLKVTGTNDADQLKIEAIGGHIFVREVVKGQTLFMAPLEEVQHIVVDANGGDDWVEIDELTLSIPTTIYGDGGNDTLKGGAGSDRLYGGSGDDQLVGRAGDDTLEGGFGNDLLVGGDGNDLLKGGRGNDSLVGGDGADFLMGEEGDDTLVGEAGNDQLFGGPGRNLMDGGAGDDGLYGGDGIDEMFGGEGNDFLRGFKGDDRINGEGGHDTILADEGEDIVTGGDGDDQINGAAGNDMISGGLGNDILAGGDGQDWLDGDDGDDLLNGGAGNDWLQGGYGSDQLNGGSGDNKGFQDYPDGFVRTSTTVQPLIFGDIWDAIEDGADWVVDQIGDIVKWTLDKAQAVANSFYEWASHIDDRLLRAADNLVDALSNWPWEADFWKGLGRTAVSALEVAGLGEAWEIAFEILKPWQRGLTSEEIDTARSVFGDSIPYEMVRIDEYSLMAAIGRTHVTGYIINTTGSMDDETLIHELTHVWQYVQDGLVYIPEAIAGQVEGYEYGGVDGLKDAIAAGKKLTDFNPEQQGLIVGDYFTLRQKARTFEANGLTAPLELRQKLDVYVHFVKEVSTLSAQELDTPSPVIHVGQVVQHSGQVFQAELSASQPSSRPQSQPVASPVQPDRVDGIFAQFAQERSVPRVSAAALELDLQADEVTRPIVRALAADRVLSVR